MFGALYMYISVDATKWLSYLAHNSKSHYLGISISCIWVHCLLKKWYFVSKIVLTFCEKNLFLSREKFVITIYRNSERSEQFLEQNTTFTYFRRFLRSKTSEQLEFIIFFFFFQFTKSDNPCQRRPLKMARRSCQVQYWSRITLRHPPRRPPTAPKNVCTTFKRCYSYWN